MSFSVAGKTAIVTGAASGPGLAIARHFIERGAQVMFADRDRARLLDCLGPMGQADDGPGRVFGGDLRRRLGRANLVSATLEAFGRIDILVNAAHQVAACDPLSPDDDAVEALFATNALATLRLSQLVARRMAGHPAESGGGAIITLTGRLPERAGPERLALSIAGGAVEQITRALALALAPQGIRVNALAIGDGALAGLQGPLCDGPAATLPLPDRTPGAREMVETVQFLASDAARLITGQVIALDGGPSAAD